MSDAAALRSRWRAFLARMEERFEELLQEARDTLPALALPAAEGGIQPYLLAAQALRSQLMGLCTKIDETWRDKVEPEAAALDPDYDWRLDDERLGTALTESIYARLDRVRIELDGAAAERVFATAEVAAARERRCQECSATLEGIGALLRASYVRCPYCGYTGTYEPPTDIRQLGWFAIDALARARTLASWDRLQEAHRQFSAHRSPKPTEARETLRAAHMEHYEDYLATRIRLAPELESDLEGDRGRFTREIDQFLSIHS